MRPDAQFLPYRESEDIEKFLNEFYKETDVDPKRIEYVEAHAAGNTKMIFYCIMLRFSISW